MTGMRMTPEIHGRRVTQVVLDFTPPIDLETFASLAKQIGGTPSAPHAHFFTQFPVYTFGEITAVASTCECGVTMRERV